MRFQDYLAWMKPTLDAAFDEQLSLFLRDTNREEAAPLKGSLNGGKRIRGCLVCMVSKALGGNLESALPRAVAIELIQTATLIHDDFVDQDTVRRGRPATWTLAGARKAVLLGDVIFATANKMMNDLGREDGLVISEAIAQIAFGAYHEPLNPAQIAREVKSNSIKADLYEKIIRLKTGALFGAATHLGAIAAGADSRVSEQFRLYGLRIGEAYQIADDLQDVRQCLSRKTAGQDQMALLTPTFLYFVEEMQSHIPRLFKKEVTPLDETLLMYFRRLERFMKQEIDSRLEIAVTEIGKSFPQSTDESLIEQAPWGIIKMMLEQ